MHHVSCQNILKKQYILLLCPQARRLLLRVQQSSIGRQSGESKALGVVLTGATKGLGCASFGLVLLNRRGKSYVARQCSADVSTLLENRTALYFQRVYPAVMHPDVQGTLVTLCTNDPASRYAMAQQFLAARDAVVLCGRCERRLESALTSLRADFPGAKVALALLDDSAASMRQLCMLLVA